ncbi:MAG: Rpp14/Pop5 family protein [Candidatus Hodarchaeales archaeon]|jgi:RNase P/RNase MRP subunit POP5
MKKERVRYLTVRFIGQESISEKDAWFLLASEVKRLFGVTGAAKVGLYLSYFDPQIQGGVFRMSHQSVHLIRASICFIHSHHSHPIYIYSECLTGSLKKAKEYLSQENYCDRYNAIKKTLGGN